MKSVLYTSVLQTPILLLGSLIILILGMKALGSWDQMLQLCDVKPNYEGATGTMIHLMRSNSDPQYPWLGALIGSAVIGFWYWCTDQYIVQRVLSGKNERESRRGTIFGAYLKLLPVFLFLIPGMIAFALHQKYVGEGGAFLPLLADGTPNADAAFPTLVAKILPAGVKGLVVCGILAALMSSLASLFNSSAMLFTIDFWKRLKPQTSEKNLVRIGQTATVVIVILGILWIPIMRSVGNVLYNYLQDVQSVLAPGIAAAFLLGITWKRASAKGGMWGLLSGIIIGLTRLGAKVYYSNATDAADSWFKAIFYDFNWLFFCGVMLVVCCLVVIIVSLCTEAPDEQKIQGLVFGTSTPEQRAATRASWNHWDIIHTVIILGFTVAFYIYFW
jgi:SSS family solute:Na+ symporter